MPAPGDLLDPDSLTDTLVELIARAPVTGMPSRLETAGMDASGTPSAGRQRR